MTHVSAQAARSTLTETVIDLLNLTVSAPDHEGIVGFTDLAGLAVHDDPHRAHLLVSKVLGQHLPVDPRGVLDAGSRLADGVIDVLGRPLDESGLVLGYGEAATGLGHTVAERLHATYLHTTRKQHPRIPVAASVEDPHEGALLLQPDHGVSLAGSGPMVVVVESLYAETGVLDAIELLHAQFPRPAYVIAVLLDTRTPTERAAFEARAERMGTDVSVAALWSGHLSSPANLLDLATAARRSLPAPAPSPAGELAEVRRYDNLWPENVPVTARHAMRPAETTRLRETAGHVALALLPHVAKRGSVLVLGTEELSHLPTHVGAELARHLPNLRVWSQSSTRFAARAADDSDYALRRSVEFAAADEPGRVSRVHNLYDPCEIPEAGQSWSDLRHDDIVVIVDAPAAACADMVDVLRAHATGTVHLVTVTPVPTTL